MGPSSTGRPRRSPSSTSPPTSSACARGWRRPDARGVAPARPFPRRLRSAMAFEIVKTFVVRSPTEQVWSFLTDPEKVARCLPGAAITGKIDEKTWQGTMTVKVGPVSSSYKGKVAFEKLDAAARTAEILASGQDVRGRGGADLRLTSTLLPKAPGETEVTTTSRVNV